LRQQVGVAADVVVIFHIAGHGNKQYQAVGFTHLQRLFFEFQCASLKPRLNDNSEVHCTFFVFSAAACSPQIEGRLSRFDPVSRMFAVQCYLHIQGSGTIGRYFHYDEIVAERTKDFTTKLDAASPVFYIKQCLVYTQFTTIIFHLSFSLLMQKQATQRLVTHAVIALSPGISG